jgi:hypothetical protein
MYNLILNNAKNTCDVISSIYRTRQSGFINVLISSQKFVFISHLSHDQSHGFISDRFSLIYLFLIKLYSSLSFFMKYFTFHFDTKSQKNKEVCFVTVDYKIVFFHFLSLNCTCFISVLNTQHCFPPIVLRVKLSLILKSLYTP